MQNIDPKVIYNLNIETKPIENGRYGLVKGKDGKLHWKKEEESPCYWLGEDGLHSIWGNGIPDTGFVKHDSGKVEYHHIPWEVMGDVACILTDGEKKYPGENWKKCRDKNRYLNAAQRHVIKWSLNERKDEESGYSHLAHAICNLLFLAQLEKEGKI